MKTNKLTLVLILVAALLLAGCSSSLRVGALQTESQSVELGDAKSVGVKILFAAGNLQLSGGAEELLQADFTYNVAELKPEVAYKNGTLVIRGPETKRVFNPIPDFRGISDFRNEWGLRLNNQVPMDLSVEMGAGNSDLQLSGLSLNGLDVSLGAGTYSIDLSGDWARDLDVTIDAGLANVSVRLPNEVGARVKVESGLYTIETSGLAKDGDVYTNAAYGASDVTLRVDVQGGLGQINLVVDESKQAEK